jgi:putative PIN family toxin of toxin-antitoxin system
VIRIVIDTNVVVSAMLRAGGLPETVFNLAISGEVQLFVSEPVVAEYEEVLRRPRLAIDPQKVTGAMAEVRAAASLVRPHVPVTAALDPDDNIFLECAESAAAHFLVTGNVKDFPATWMGTRVVTPRQFLEAIALRQEPFSS